MEIPQKNATVDDVAILSAAGPWRTKSGGSLSVPFSMKVEEALEYVSGHAGISDEAPDIRGLRIYMISDLENGAIGGGEFHRVRKEYAFTASGSVRWACEDLFGGTETFDVPAGHGLFIPPTIMHTYTVTSDATQLLVIANTMFNPNDLRTHDTYDREAFTELKEGK